MVGAASVLLVGAFSGLGQGWHQATASPAAFVHVPEPPPGAVVVFVPLAEGAPADAPAMVEVCAGMGGDDRQACYGGLLADVLRARGAPDAFHELEAVVALDPDAYGWSHHLAHELGRVAFSFYGTPSAALPLCSMAYAAGCPHGVIEAYFQSGAEVDAAALRSLCGGGPAGKMGAFALSQCLHGLGHGLDIQNGHDLFATLDQCRSLADSWQLDTCARGAFMENIVYDMDPQGTQDAISGHHHAAVEQHPTGLRADDLLFPCDQVGPDVQPACYSMQTSVMLRFNGWDIAATFAECQGAPAAVQGECFSSLGRDIGTFTQGVADQSMALCSGAPDAGPRQECIRGLVAERMNGSGDIHAGFPLCALAVVGDKAACYAVVASMMRFMEPDAALRAAACEGAEPAFHAACAA